MTIQGVEIGQIENWAIELSKINTKSDSEERKVVMNEILMANLDIAIKFKKEADKKIRAEFDDKPKTSKEVQKDIPRESIGYTDEEEEILSKYDKQTGINKLNL